MVDERRFWGDRDEERLTHTDPNDAIEEILDALHPVGLDEIGEVTVCEYRPMTPTLPSYWSPLEIMLENLDEEFSDPDGNGTKATEAMRAAEKAFIAAVLAEYESWACEPTGKEITVNALEWVREHRPGWLEEARAAV